jgi:hypothetical protein
MDCRTSQRVSGAVSCSLAAFPKCPLCLMSLVGASGLGWLPFVMWLPNLLAVSIIVTLTLLARQAIKDRTWTPIVFGLGTSALLIAVSQGLIRPTWIALAPAALVISAWGVRFVGRRVTMPSPVVRT